MQKRLICLGDSNTWGYDPRDPFGGRLPAEERWVDLLAAASGAAVFNLGLNGRTIPRGGAGTEALLSQLRRYAPADLLIVMLGSNDALTLFDSDAEEIAEEIAGRMERFLDALRAALPDLPLLLISPPRVDVPYAHLEEVFLLLPPLLSEVARRCGARFVSAADWELRFSDGVHLTPESHRLFAEKLWGFLQS